MELHSPFQWPDPINERKAKGGLFYGGDGSRAGLIGHIKVWLREAQRESPSSIPCLHGPYGVGKTSVIQHSVYQYLQENADSDLHDPEILMLGSHGSPFNYGSVRSFARDYVKDQLADRVEPQEQEAIQQQILDTRSQRRVVEILLGDAGLGQEIVRLVEVCHSADSYRGMTYLCEFLAQRRDTCGVIVIIHGSRIDSTIHTSLLRQRIPFLVERWHEPSMPQTRLVARKYSMYRKGQTSPRLRPLEVQALRTGEALCCIHCNHPRVNELGVDPPHFCRRRECPVDPAIGSTALCPRSPDSTAGDGICAEAINLIRYAGTHPGFLQMLCNAWHNKRAIGPTMTLDAWIDNQKQDSRLWKHFRSWQASLERDAQTAAQSWIIDGAKGEDVLDRLEQLGVVYTDPSDQERKVARLVEEFWLDNPINENGGISMNPGQAIAKWVWSKVVGLGEKHVSKQLQKVWEEVFPPTPVYIGALRSAVGDAKQLWSSEGESVLDLDVEVALAGLDWQTLDSTQIKNLPSVSKEQIAELLLEKVTGNADQSTRIEFVDRIVEAADGHFRKAIMLEGSQSAALWKEYVLCAAERQQATQAEVLAKVRGIEQKLGVLLTVDPTAQGGQVFTTDEVLGSEEELEKGATRIEVSPSADLAKIDEYEFWDRYNDAWRRFWLAKERRNNYQTTLDGLRRIMSIRPLSSQEQRTLEAASENLRGEREAIAQARADLKAMQKRAEDLF